MAMPSSSTKEKLHSEKQKRKSQEDSSSFPMRDCDKLFAQVETVDYALHTHCVPCAYKIGCFDDALDREFTKHVPIQRPEQCPRVEIVPRGYLQISFLQPIRECQRSKGISRSKTLVVIV
jgi:hypothetical protein